MTFHGIFHGMGSAGAQHGELRHIRLATTCWSLTSRQGGNMKGSSEIVGGQNMGV